MILKIILALAFVATASGCEKKAERELPKIKSVKLEQYVVTHVDQPKHFWVNLKHLDTGFVFERTARRKHCNKWREMPVGSVILVETYHYENGTFAVSSDGAAARICD